ncbi:MAG: invasion associated locus B family protein [Alphaproteobacteria bacterium]|nr:invasion associated locus B family protein [Alphaproteobacteria bacterium]
MRLFLVTGIVAGILNAGGVVTAWSADAPGSAQKTPPAAADQKSAAQTEASLPNGASSINETYGDWVVDCRVIEGQKQCLLVQAQVNNQTRQRMFEIQLHAPKDAKTEGTVLMPFGLKLDSGAIVTLDDKDIGQALRFSTCTPQGCLLPVSFAAATVDSMKKSKTLSIASLNLGNGEVVAFKISLEGFAHASARVTELSK